MELMKPQADFGKMMLQRVNDRRQDKMSDDVMNEVENSVVGAERCRQQIEDSKKNLDRFERRLKALEQGNFKLGRIQNPGGPSGIIVYDDSDLNFR